jgi:hypothetical protein
MRTLDTATGDNQRVYRQISHFLVQEQAEPIGEERLHHLLEYRRGRRFVRGLRLDVVPIAPADDRLPLGTGDDLIGTNAVHLLQDELEREIRCNEPSARLELDSAAGFFGRRARDGRHFEGWSRRLRGQCDCPCRRDPE